MGESLRGKEILSVDLILSGVEKGLEIQHKENTQCIGPDLSSLYCKSFTAEINIIVRVITYLLNRGKGGHLTFLLHKFLTIFSPVFLLCIVRARNSSLADRFAVTAAHWPLEHIEHGHLAE